jgi:hypothetical protein
LSPPTEKADPDNVKIMAIRDVPFLEKKATIFDDPAIPAETELSLRAVDTKESKAIDIEPLDMANAVA